jgi:TRAP-type C4-dicarboxylate transport system permease small subunit
MMNEKIKQIGIFLLRAHDSLCKWCAHISAWMILVMTLSIAYEVLVRYFFIRPTSWVSDFTDYTLLYITFLSSAWLLKLDQHVSLTVLLEQLSPRSRRVMEVVSSVLGAIVCGFIIWYGVADSWDAFARHIKVDRPLPVPKYLLLAVIPFGCLLLLVQFFRNAFRSLSALKDMSKTE